MRIDGRATRAALASLSKDVGHFVHAALVDAGKHAVAEAKATTLFQSHTGALRSSVGFTMSGNWSGLFEATAPYAVYVEGGTRPHVIEPRNAPMLRFRINGEWVSARRVQHPGTKPTLFMHKALEAADAPRSVAYAVETAVASFNGH